MVIRVRHGKGGKDRFVMLSAQLLGMLARPAEWLFPGRDASGPIDVQVLYSVCRSACTAASLGKTGDGAYAPAQLRHAPAGERHRPAHHSGAAGHSNLSSTARYTQVSTGLIRRTASPLGRLKLEAVPPA